MKSRLNREPAKGNNPVTEPTFTRCCACGDRIPPSRDPRRPGLTAVHHLRPGVRCPGSDAPFASHAAPAVEMTVNVGVLFGALEQAVA